MSYLSLSQSWRTLLASYTAALSRRTPPDPRTFPPLLKASTSLGAPPLLGLTLHQHAIVLGYADDAYISSSLVCMYAKLGDICSARRVFDDMPFRTVVPWSAIVGAYSQLGDVGSAFWMYSRMCNEGIEPNSVTVLGLLSGVVELDQLMCLHAWVIRSGFEDDIVVTNSMLNVYARCGEVELARRLFNLMACRDVVSWNSMLAGYSRYGNIRECVYLFDRMRSEGINPDHQTFGSLASSAAAVASDHGGSLQLGKQVHAQIITSGLESDAHINTTLTAMYLKCRKVESAFLLFHRSKHKDIISWTAMISGLVQNDRANEALLLSHGMLRSGLVPSTTTIATALAACAHLGSFHFGASIHGYIIRQRITVDRAVENSLVSMYAKCGHLKQCQSIFNAMQDKDVVSWNAIVSAHAQNGHLDGAFLFFSRMRLSSVRPDSITVVILLQACASLGALHYGKCVHSFMIRSEPRPCISIGTSLIDMYSKCGDLGSAQRCFNTMTEHDLVSWSAIIAAYGSHGRGVTAVEMYGEFLRTGMEPNQVMFLSVLTACSHSGLVLQGLEIFQTMKQDFGLEPTLEHHACIIDLLGRAGRIQEALGIIKTMHSQPNADVLGILLDACRIHRNASIGEEIAREIIALKPETAGSYVQLAHCYAAINRWDSVGESWRQMRSLGLRKPPAWSFIELNGTITPFFADHTSHPQFEEMILLLKTVDKEMRKLTPVICAR